MRNQLITTLHCSKCGEVLELHYPDDNMPKVSYGYDLPTGGAMVKNIVYVEPCRHCIEKYTGPAKQLAKAIKDLT